MFQPLAMITIQEISNLRGLLISCSGDLDAKELCEEMKTLKDRFPGISSWMFVITDLSSVANLTVTAADFDLLVELDRKLAHFTRPGLPVAVIARSELAFGISRMWQVACESTGWEAQVFRERPPAEAWIRHRVLSLFQCELPELSLASGKATAHGSTT